jgi:hypothetical protein
MMRYGKWVTQDIGNTLLEMMECLCGRRMHEDRVSFD